MLCNTGVDRLTFSVIWEMTGEGRILKQWSGRTVIRSCAKLAYGHAQDMIEGSFDASQPPVALSTPHTWDQVSAEAWNVWLQTHYICLGLNDQSGTLIRILALH